VIDDDKKN